MKSLAASVFVLPLLASLPAHTCDPLLNIDPVESRNIPFEKHEASLAGFWWVTVPTDYPSSVELIDQSNQQRFTAPPEDVLARGSRSFALAVPPNSLVGQVFGFSAPNINTRLVVSEFEDGTDPLIPTIQSISSIEESEIRAEGCGPGFTQLREDFFSQVRLEISAPPGITIGDLLLDVWLLPIGTPLPDNSVERALENVLASSVLSDSSSFNVSRPGEWDIHVRLTGPRTAISSEIHSTSINNDRPSEPRGADFTRWSWGCGAFGGGDMPTSAFFGLAGALALAKRARRRRLSANATTSGHPGVRSQPTEHSRKGSRVPLRSTRDHTLRVDPASGV